jgi:hypothetical protein
MVQKGNEIGRLLQAAEEKMTRLQRFQRQVEEYKRENRSMKTVIEESLGIVREVEQKTVKKCDSTGSEYVNSNQDPPIKCSRSDLQDMVPEIAPQAAPQPSAYHLSHSMTFLQQVIAQMEQTDDEDIGSESDSPERSTPLECIPLSPEVPNYHYFTL